MKSPKIPNVIPELRKILISGAYIQWRGLLCRGVILRGHFMLVSAYQEFKIYHYINEISMAWAKNIFLSLNNLYLT